MLNQVLLTGGTGFIGPFLMKSLLEQTRAKIYVLVRSSDEKQGRQRLRAAMESMGSCGAGLMEMFEDRVIPVCGDLGQSNLGLTQDMWDFLASEIDTVFHNGATVNYLFNYDLMRDADDPNHFLLYEVYRDAEALDAHRNAPHFKTWDALTAPWMAEPRTRVISQPLFYDDEEVGAARALFADEGEQGAHAWL